MQPYDDTAGRSGGVAQPMRPMHASANGTMVPLRSRIFRSQMAGVVMRNGDCAVHSAGEPAPRTGDVGQLPLSLPARAHQREAGPRGSLCAICELGHTGFCLMAVRLCRAGLADIDLARKRCEYSDLRTHRIRGPWTSQNGRKRFVWGDGARHSHKMPFTRGYPRKAG